ncbi:MAG TPA: DUF6308 family protein [Candidatus Sulfotelmatobacter sp.]|nr:DUF6308 family protein [Candidatus Sulfotelmatobacter sp.]
MTALPTGGQAIRLRRADVIVEAPWKTAVKFFTENPSSLGPQSYDAYVMAGGSPPDSITEDDVRAINVTMGARSPHSDWTKLIKRGDLPELKALGRSIDLFQTSDAQWSKERVPTRLAALFNAVIGKGIGIARATKVLHIKRPRLIPVCDSYVLRLMGIPDVGADSGVALVEQIRAIRNDLLPTLLDFQERLKERGCDRTLVRILDSLLWSGYPDTWLKRR